jgi:hypothetical protein
MPPRIARLVGFGAFAASLGLVLLWALLLYVSRPTARGGIDRTQAIVAWIALSGMFAALIGAHVVIGRRLLDLGRDTARRP